ncbi:LacI family DNA-binding transcriptional regulator [Streptomyces sp. HD]|uniref:LacI family DNA-binding transcriptional regulator n=1 Tax=Streptomyces sp. HD TaxID=3020892 RepID=UPI00232E2544|nr:LacI family DNA-binding transcriptional regulator [Streptomyces sp. HD]MDC0773780.1 LacI family DNA-binding transcriptional regulator [Streptomyces sp. HD]
MVTIADVARRAGVSPSTVSYVLNGRASVSEATRRRVQRSVAKLGYHPHAGARALAGRRSHIITLVMPLRTNMFVPVMMEIAVSVTTTARRHGYDVLLITSDEGPEGVRRVAASGLADGVILMDVEVDDPRIPVLREQGTQAALIGLPDEAHQLSCVDHDFATAGALCADHLAGLGHRDVAFIGYGSRTYERHAGYAERTLAGFVERAGERGLSFLHRPCEGTYAGAAQVLDRVFAERPGTTGFVVQNEGAIGPLLTLLRTGGRAVPRNASVVALCPEQLAEQQTPALTSVSGPAAELGRVAVEQVLRRLAAAAQDTAPEDERVLLAPTLTVRQSTGPAELS